MEGSAVRGLPPSGRSLALRVFRLVLHCPATPGAWEACKNVRACGLEGGACCLPRGVRLQGCPARCQASGVPWSAAHGEGGKGGTLSAVRA